MASENHFKGIPIAVANTQLHAERSHFSDKDMLEPRVDLKKPTALRFIFPILLDGDLVQSPEHLGPAYLVSILRHAGCVCKIIEVSIDDNFEEKMLEIKNWKPDVLGLSLTTISVKNAKRFGNMLKMALPPQTFFLAGGPLATHHGEQLLSMSGWEFLDGLIRGEGEIPILRFAEAFRQLEKNFDNIPSLVYRKSGNIYKNKLSRGILDLDVLPFPARDQFEEHKDRFPYMRISTSRGCTSHCTFCNAPHARNRVGPKMKGWRGQRPKRVIDEVEYYYKKYRFNTFDFVDSTFEDPGGKLKAKERVAAIANEILNRNMKIYYNVCMQACNWHEEDKPLLALLWRSGLEKVLVGIESGSSLGLKRWQKRSTVQDNERVIRLLSDQKIYVAFGFISYHPWSSFEEVRENNQFLLNNIGHNLRRYTVRLELYPGAEVVDNLVEENLLLDSYHTELNPFAYKFVDDRIGLLASALNAIYGKQYVKDCTIESEPAVFKFETFEITSHTFFSRILRLADEKLYINEILQEGLEAIQKLKYAMCQFNYALVSEFVELAERNKLTLEYGYKKRHLVEKFYQEKLDQFRSCQLKVSMKLYRQKFDVRQLALA